MIAAPPRGEKPVLIKAERRTRAERLAEGIPLPDEAWKAISRMAREAGVLSLAENI